MSPARAKAPLFPYIVMFYVIAGHLLLSGISVYAVLHRPVSADYEQYHDMLLYSMLGGYAGFLVVLAAFGFAATQWMLERRSAARLPGFAAPLIGLLSVLLAVAWGVGSTFLLEWIRALTSGAGLQFALTVNVLLGYLVGPLWIVLSVSLVFRLLRSREVRASFPTEVRGSALLIVALFAWAWVTLAVRLATPVAAHYFGEDIGLSTIYLWPYVGCFVLVLPPFLGALWGLPASMRVARPVRLWLVATLAMLVTAASMVALTFAAVYLAQHFIDGFAPGIGFSVLLALVWFIVSTPLCGLLVRALTRTPGLPESNDYADRRLPDFVH